MFSKLFIFLFAVSWAFVLASALPTEDHKLDDELHASTRASCVLPMEIGVCRARMPRWGYDPERKECVNFFYGGCFGNANNFMTKEECVNLCRGV